MVVFNLLVNQHFRVNRAAKLVRERVKLTCNYNGQ